MTHRLIHCDGSEFSFLLRQDEAEWVAFMYFRGEPLGCEFRGDTPDALRLSMAEWLLRLTTDARALQ